MYRVRAQNRDDNGTQRADDVTRVFERTGHGQYPRAQTGLQKMYQGVEIPKKKKKKHPSVKRVEYLYIYISVYCDTESLFRFRPTSGSAGLFNTHEVGCFTSRC